MNHAATIDAFERAAATFIEVIASSDLGAPVPACPEWTVRDLARHIGGIQRWSSELIRSNIIAETFRFELPLDYPADQCDTNGMVSWLHQSASEAIESYRAADPDAPVWAWGHDQHARWWPRRMLFEAAIHIDDALGATSGLNPYVVAPPLAADGIEEFLENLAFLGRFGVDVRQLIGAGETVSIVADDTDQAWRCKLEPQGMWWERTGASANATVSGPAHSVLLSLSGRARHDVEVSGDVMLYARTLGSLTF